MTKQELMDNIRRLYDLQNAGVAGLEARIEQLERELYNKMAEEWQRDYGGAKCQ